MRFLKYKSWTNRECAIWINLNWFKVIKTYSKIMIYNFHYFFYIFLGRVDMDKRKKVWGHFEWKFRIAHNHCIENGYKNNFRYCISKITSLLKLISRLNWIAVSEQLCSLPLPLQSPLWPTPSTSLKRERLESTTSMEHLQMKWDIDILCEGPAN